MMFLVLQHRDNDVIETYLPPLPDSYHNISYGATIAGKTILFSVSLKGVSCVLDRWGVEQCHIRCHERRCKANFTASSWVCVCLQRPSFFSHPTKWSILVPLHTLCKSYENSRLLYVHFVLVSCVWANIWYFVFAVYWYCYHIISVRLRRSKFSVFFCLLLRLSPCTYRLEQRDRHGRHSWVRLGIYFDVPVPVGILLGLTSWANISSIVRVRRFVRTAMARNFKGEKENEFGGEKWKRHIS